MKQALQIHLNLARASNLPTVASNVLCACLLSGQFSLSICVGAIIAACLLYTGGMYLNDWSDANYDRQHRPERPIPAQQISRKAVGLWTIAYLALAAGISCLMNPAGLLWLGLLLAAIVAYDLHHKNNAYSPLLMAACRALLYPWTASLHSASLSAVILIAALGAFSYTLALTWIARAPSLFKQRPIPMSALIALPAILWLAYTKGHLSIGIAAVLLGFALWCAYSLSGLYRSPMDVGFTIQNLIAGLCAVDLMAISFYDFLSLTSALCFGALLISTVLFQQKIIGT